MKTKAEILSTKIKNRETLSVEECQYLAARANISVVNRLVTDRLYNFERPIIKFGRPVAFLPLSSDLEKYGSYKTIRRTVDKLAKFKSKSRQYHSLYLAIDRWHGKFLLPDLLATLNEIRDVTSHRFKINYICPSSYEILAAIGARNETVCFYSAVEDILRDLLSHGFNNLDGGRDLIIHKIAADLGFSGSAAHVISYPCLNKGFTNYLKNKLLPDVWYLSKEIAKPGSTFKWFITLDRDLSQIPSSSKANLLKKLAKLLGICRIVLPDSVTIRAPLSRFGIDYYRTALAVGAEDFGDFAVNKQTAAALQIRPISEAPRELQLDTAEF